MLQVEQQMYRFGFVLMFWKTLRSPAPVHVQLRGPEGQEMLPGDGALWRLLSDTLGIKLGFNSCTGHFQPQLIVCAANHRDRKMRKLLRKWEMWLSVEMKQKEEDKMLLFMVLHSLHPYLHTPADCVKTHTQMKAHTCRGEEVEADFWTRTQIIQAEPFPPSQQR